MERDGQGASRGARDAEFARAFQVEPVSRIADRVADQVRAYIVDNDLAEGARLPSERRLAELVGSSRPTVSQALRSLAVLGLIEIKPGSGAFVLRRPGVAVGEGFQMMIQLAPESVHDMVRLRHLLEQGAASEIMCSGSPGLSDLENALALLRRSRGSVAEWVAADTNFHVEFVRLAENTYLTSLFESAHGAVVSKAYEHWIAANEPPGWLRGPEFDEQIALHEPIVVALRANDRDALLRALREHQDALETHMKGPGDRADEKADGR
ncbi:GntR family transcriptional regulator [Streptomyces sp. NPDC026672]|uniref:FadR/GntR family transcriptional regulator n=1 Tax=unclassified Streptomyces TaxID=2593676 RepID=UPI0033CFF4D0